jgi:low temperature requirement protein LtrA
MSGDDALSPQAQPSADFSVGGHERHATWLELFFDLVFVAAITAIGGQLAAQSTVTEAATHMLLFVPIWWAWVGHTVYANRFDRDDRLHRFLTCAMMFAAAGMLIQLDRIVETGGVGFVVAYFAARLALLLLYARERQPQALRQLYLRGFGLGAAVWLLSLLVPPPARYGVWIIGLAVDLATPWLGRAILQRSPLHVAHLPERMGLFTLLLLGESIVAVVSSLSHEAWGIERVGIATMAFVIAVSIWWSYFAFVERTRFECRLGSGQPYIYTHLPVALGLVSLAAGIKRAIHEGTSAALSELTLFLLGLGATVWLLAFLAVQLVSYVVFPKGQVWLYTVASIVVVLIMGLGSVLSPLVVFGGLTAIFLIVAGLGHREPTFPMSAEGEAKAG